VKLKRFGEQSDLHLGSLEACAKAKLTSVSLLRKFPLGWEYRWNWMESHIILFMIMSCIRIRE